jgi:Icc protein
MLTALHLSDIHLTANGAPVYGHDPDYRLERVLEAIALAGDKPDIVLLTGDLTDDASLSGCRRLAGRLALLGRPILAVPGNHDHPGHVQDTFGKADRTLGEWRFVGVDTSRAGQIHGTVDVEHVARRLGESSAPNVLLLMHHPPVSPSRNPSFQLDGANALAELLGVHPEVRGLLTGHLHQPFEASFMGVKVHGAPSALIAFRHAGHEFEIGGTSSTGVNVVTLADDGGVSVSFVRA